jgi:hypothetical protein
MTSPEDELGRLARSIPAWLSEVFYFSPAYAPVAALGIVHEPDGSRHPMLFDAEWTTETIRQLVDTTEGGLDYVFTGALAHRSGDYEVVLRVWEVKKYRERKQFTARWAPATADAELARLRDEVCLFMEWSPYAAGAGLAYSPPVARAWIDVLGASLGTFLCGKDILPISLLPPMEPLAAQSARLAPDSEAASLAWITLSRRCRALGLPAPAGPGRLFESPRVTEAERLE